MTAASAHPPRQGTEPHVVCAPDKLRGALRAARAAAALADGVHDAGGRAIELPLADGGEGTLDALCSVGIARPVPVAVHDAFGRPIEARVGDLGDGVWLIEVAEAAGHHLLDALDPRRASTAGVGELLLAVLERAPARVLIALGGSATVDGGIGLLHALRAARGMDGEALLAGEQPQLAVARERVAGVALEVLHDVDVPLCGAHGAALLFGAQKGMTPYDAPRFDAALAAWGAALGDGIATMPGAGAAGGLGAALYALGASPHRGAERVLELVGFKRVLAGAALCLTAEGSVDESTLHGKTVTAVLDAAVAAGVPTVVLGGRVEHDAAAELRSRGARDVCPLGPPERPLPLALADAAADLRRCAADACAATWRARG